MYTDSEGNILIIVSDKETQDFLSALLMGEGYQTKVCSNQVEGLEALGKEAFNLVISDFQTSNINGIENLQSNTSKFFPSPHTHNHPDG